MAPPPTLCAPLTWEGLPRRDRISEEVNRIAVPFPPPPRLALLPISTGLRREGRYPYQIRCEPRNYTGGAARRFSAAE